MIFHIDFSYFMVLRILKQGKLCINVVFTLKFIFFISLTLQHSSYLQNTARCFSVHHVPPAVYPTKLVEFSNFDIDMNQAQSRAPPCYVEMSKLEHPSLVSWPWCRGTPAASTRTRPSCPCARAAPPPTTGCCAPPPPGTMTSLRYGDLFV